MKEITRYDFCVDDIGNEEFMPCPDGRYVLLEEIEAYLPHTDEDYINNPLREIKYGNLLVTKEVDKAMDEKYIYLPMKKGVRNRYNKQTCQFEQSREIDERVLWNDHVQRAQFYVVDGSKEMRNHLAEIMNKEKQNDQD